MVTNLPATLEDAIRAFGRAAESPNTRRAYRADFGIFLQWCESHALEALPATTLTVCAFLTDQAKSGISAATLERRTAAIAFVHRAAKHESPIDDHVRRIMRGIRRTVGRTAHGKAALTADKLKQLVDAIPADGLRDRALILLGFGGAFRRSELGALRREDLEFQPDGLLIAVRQSKTDQDARGQVIAVTRADNPAYCPVLAVENWLAVSEGEFVFGLSGQRISVIVKRWAAKAGFNPDEFGAHSLRSGFVTSAVLNGAPLVNIMQVTRHKSLTSVQKYFKYELLKKHPGRGIL